MTTVVEWLNGVMTGSLKMKPEIANAVDGLAAGILILMVSIGINWLCQSIFRWATKRDGKKDSSKWRPYLSKRKLGHNILLLVPGLVFYGLVWVAFGKGSQPVRFLHRMDIAYMVIVIVMILNSVLMSFLDVYSKTDKHRRHPMQGVIQGLQVVLYFVGAIIVVAVLIDKSPTVLLTGLGASAAVLMLIFKDSILGFVAGVQLSQNRMVQIGDWIQMPDGSANGTVEEITLNTVKVRNWDNTLTMIPPYTLVSTPFKNWRGMQESGGRRANKCIYIDVNSLEVCGEDMMEDIAKNFPIIADHIKSKSGQKDVTNIQLYRAYIETFLRTDPEINTSLDLIITQKEATPYGLPVQVYFFLKDKAWASFERKQSDIFDHLMTIVPEFGLRIYQRP